VFSDGAERVLSEMLFHADVVETVKARPPIVAWRTIGTTRSAVKHQDLYLPSEKPQCSDMEVFQMVNTDLDV